MLVHRLFPSPTCPQKSTPTTTLSSLSNALQQVVQLTPEFLFLFHLTPNMCWQRSSNLQFPASYSIFTSNRISQDYFYPISPLNYTMADQFEPSSDASAFTPFPPGLLHTQSSSTSNLPPSNQPALSLYQSKCQLVNNTGGSCWWPGPHQFSIEIWFMNFDIGSMQHAIPEASLLI